MALYDMQILWPYSTGNIFCKKRHIFLSLINVTLSTKAIYFVAAWNYRSSNMQFSYCLHQYLNKIFSKKNKQIFYFQWSYRWHHSIDMQILGKTDSSEQSQIFENYIGVSKNSLGLTLGVPKF